MLSSEEVDEGWPVAMNEDDILHRVVLRGKARVVWKLLAPLSGSKPKAVSGGSGSALRPAVR